jgi:hypothetical protein
MALILLSIWGIAGGSMPFKRRLPEAPEQPGAACDE